MFIVWSSPIRERKTRSIKELVSKSIIRNQIHRRWMKVERSKDVQINEASGKQDAWLTLNSCWLRSAKRKFEWSRPDILPKTGAKIHSSIPTCGRMTKSRILKRNCIWHAISRICELFAAPDSRWDRAAHDDCSEFVGSTCMKKSNQLRGSTGKKMTKLYRMPKWAEPSFCQRNIKKEIEVASWERNLTPHAWGAGPRRKQSPTSYWFNLIKGGHPYLSRCPMTMTVPSHIEFSAGHIRPAVYWLSSDWRVELPSCGHLTIELLSFSLGFALGWLFSRILAPGLCGASKEQFIRLQTFGSYIWSQISVSLRAPLITSTAPGSGMKATPNTATIN